MRDFGRRKGPFEVEMNEPLTLEVLLNKKTSLFGPPENQEF